jgi:hypothetical protein
MSRIALCLFGSTGYKQKLGRGHQLNLEKYSIEEPLNSINQNIVKPHNCDVFIHSWSVENKELIIQIFNPVKFSFETHKQFDRNISSKKNATLSRFYSEFKSNELKMHYENEKNFNYDVVIHSRMDIIWFNKMNLVQKPGTFFASNWNSSINDNNLGPFNKLNHHQSFALHDWWFFAESNLMDRFSNIYKQSFLFYLKNKREYNAHRFSYLMTKRLNVNIENIHYRGHDFELYRRYIRNDWKN